METQTTTTQTGPIPTQVQHPWKAALRTGIQAAVPTLITAAGILMLFADHFKGLPPEVTASVLAFAGFTVSAAMFLTAVMNMPTVNALLTKFGLGAVPKQAQDSLEGYFSQFPDAEAQKIPVREVTHEDGVG